ncbi:unnamed protein product, partial [Urochloa humidicola]
SGGVGYGHGKPRPRRVVDALDGVEGGEEGEPEKTRGRRRRIPAGRRRVLRRRDQQPALFRVRSAGFQEAVGTMEGCIISEDLIINEILMRLPVKSLLRF